MKRVRKKVISLFLTMILLSFFLIPQKAMAASSNWHHSANNDKIDVYMWDENGEYVQCSSNISVGNNDKVILPKVKTRYQFVVRSNGSACDWRIKSTSTSVTRIDG